MVCPQDTSAQVGPGYRLAEMGVIPKDWEVRRLGEVVDFLDGQRRPVKDSDRAKMRGDIPYYGASGIVDYVNDYIFDDDLILLGEDGENILSRNCRLVFQISGKAWVNNHAHVLKPNPGNDIGYLTEYLEGLDYDQYNTGTAQPKLNKHVCPGIPVLRPPLPEQHAIAAALGDVFLISTGTSKSPYIVCEGRYWIVDMGSVSITGKLVVSKATDYSGDFLQIGDLVMPKDDIGGGNIIGKAGYIAADNVYVLGDHVYCLRVKKGDPLFFSYVINGYQTNSSLRKKVIGSAQLGLGRKSVDEQEISIPSLPEQTAIAAVLSDMDAEIAALETRRDKTRLLKQGMMQELLTGKTRLV